MNANNNEINVKPIKKFHNSKASNIDEIYKELIMKKIIMLSSCIFVSSLYLSRNYIIC